MRSRRPGAFYGWWIIAWTSLLLAFAAGLGQTQAYSVLLGPLGTRTGLSPGEFAGIFLVGALLVSATIPIFGRMVDIWGPQRVLIPAVAGYAAAIALTAAASLIGPSIEWLTVASMLMTRVLAAGAIWVSASVLVAWWFRRRRGLALGLVAAFSAGGSAFIPFLIGLALIRSDVTVVLTVSAVLIAAIALPVAIWGLVDRPATIGQVPDGGTATAATTPPPATGLRPRQAYATGFLLLLTACNLSFNVFGQGFVFHQVAVFADQGLSPAAAAFNFLPQAIGSMIGFLSMGILVDRFRLRWIVAATVGQFLLTLTWGFHLGGAVSQFLFGLCFGIATTGIFGFALAAFPKYFGLAHIGEIRGYFGTVAILSSALGAVIYTVIERVTGSFMAILIPAAVTGAALIIWSLRIRWPEPIGEPVHRIQ